jgi:hypothetical protein
MRPIISTIIFYKRLVIPALIVSAAFGFLGMITPGGNFSLKTVGFSYFLNSLLFHYLIYEIRHPEEYYFYYNLGFNKLMLWGINLVISFVLSLIFIIA